MEEYDLLVPVSFRFGHHNELPLRIHHKIREFFHCSPFIVRSYDGTGPFPLSGRNCIGTDLFPTARLDHLDEQISWDFDIRLSLELIYWSPSDPEGLFSLNDSFPDLTIEDKLSGPMYDRFVQAVHIWRPEMHERGCTMALQGMGKDVSGEWVQFTKQMNCPLGSLTYSHPAPGGLRAFDDRYSHLKILITGLRVRINIQRETQLVLTIHEPRSPFDMELTARTMEGAVKTITINEPAQDVRNESLPRAIRTSLRGDALAPRLKYMLLITSDGRVLDPEGPAATDLVFPHLRAQGGLPYTKTLSRDFSQGRYVAQSGSQQGFPNRRRVSGGSRKEAGAYFA